MITINGSSGGGQVLRTAIALSAITQKPVRVTNIRSSRSKPGLQPQHLAGVLAAAKLCGASIEGATQGSKDITFAPGKIKGGKYKIDIGTAGSVTLILQILVPIACYADSPVELTITGGTNVTWSPSIEYFQDIFCDFANKHFKLDVSSELIKRGFYPKGGGKVVVKIAPRIPKSIHLINPGKFLKIDLHPIASKSLQSAEVCERMVEGFQSACPEEKVGVKLHYDETLSTGAEMHAHAHFEKIKLGITILGEKGKPAESIGKECARALSEEMRSKAVVDRHAADQLMIFMALAKNSEIKTSKITDHVIINKEVIEKFLPIKFQIDGTVIKC